MGFSFEYKGFKRMGEIVAGLFSIYNYAIY